MKPLRYSIDYSSSKTLRASCSHLDLYQQSHIIVRFTLISFSNFSYLLLERIFAQLSSFTSLCRKRATPHIKAEFGVSLVLQSFFLVDLDTTPLHRKSLSWDFVYIWLFSTFLDYDKEKLYIIRFYRAFAKQNIDQNTRQ